ncbi:hypothetical protein PCE1_004479 [Barthelona sp. PCE]
MMNDWDDSDDDFDCWRPIIKAEAENEVSETEESTTPLSEYSFDTICGMFRAFHMSDVEFVKYLQDSVDFSVLIEYLRQEYIVICTALDEAMGENSEIIHRGFFHTFVYVCNHFQSDVSVKDFRLLLVAAKLIMEYVDQFNVVLDFSFFHGILRLMLIDMNYVLFSKMRNYLLKNKTKFGWLREIVSLYFLIITFGDLEDDLYFDDKVMGPYIESATEKGISSELFEEMTIMLNIYEKMLTLSIREVIEDTDIPFSNIKMLSGGFK